jgi:hypothetical protein
MKIPKILTKYLEKIENIAAGHGYNKTARLIRSLYPAKEEDLNLADFGIGSAVGVPLPEILEKGDYRNKVY